MARPIRLALCDDHAMVRGGLHRILAEEPGIEVVGEAGTAEEAVELAARAAFTMLSCSTRRPTMSLASRLYTPAR